MQSEEIVYRTSNKVWKDRDIVKNNLWQLIMLCLFVLVMSQNAQATDCTTRLWPKSVLKTLNIASTKNKEILNLLIKRANISLKKIPAPIVTLKSSGVTDLKDQQLIETRRSFRDADTASVLALAHYVAKNPAYLSAARTYLTRWATTNKPTGQPIDETRLDGFLWAYDLIRCALSDEDNETIRSWLTELHLKKNAWTFGEETKINNHRTHQLKILLMLDKLLERTDDWNKDLQSAKEHAKVNIDIATGESLDYKKRDALHYHVFDLEPWVEIALITDCCQSYVDKAFDFFRKKISANDISGEFEHSTAPIDAKRAQSGFKYAQKGSQYDVSKSARLIINYHTLPTSSSTIESYLAKIVEDAKQDNRFTFSLARKELWK